MKLRDLTDEEIKLLQDFARNNRMYVQRQANPSILNYYFKDRPGQDSRQEQMYDWLRIRPNEDSIYHLTAKDIVEEYGKDFLKAVRIIEVGSGFLPTLSERLLELVPEISRIDVYDPVLYTTIFDSNLERRNRLEKMVLINEPFTPEVPIDSKKPSLIISRHPCPGTPAIIDVAGEKKSVELYCVLCRCNTKQMREGTLSYYTDRRIINGPNYSPKIHIIGQGNLEEEGFDFKWYDQTYYSLKKYRPEVISKKLKQFGQREDTVILTNPTRLK